MKRWIFAPTAAVAALVIFAPVAFAGLLEHPNSVSLKSGSSASAESQAVTLLNGTTDGQYYDITPESTKHSTVTATYIATFPDTTDAPANMKLQWEGHTTSAPCDLTLQLYNWDKRKWVGQTVTANTGSDQFLDSGPLPTKHVTRHNTAKGRVICKSTDSFMTFQSDQLRINDA